MGSRAAESSIAGVLTVALLALAVTSACSGDGDSGGLREPDPPPSRSTIRVVDSIPCLFVDGVPTPMVGFFSYRCPYDTKHDNVAHLKRYIDRAHEFGFTFVAFSFFWPSMDLDPTRPATPDEAASRIDWTVLDEIFDHARDRGVHVMPLFQYSHGTWWWHLDPELSTLSMRDQDRGQHPTNHMDKMPCFECPTWWVYLDAVVSCLVERYRDHPALLGWLLSHGMSIENNYPGSPDGGAYGTVKMYDYSDFAVAGFRDWLRVRYGDARTLRAAWGQPGVTFEDAVPPAPLVSCSDVNRIHEFCNHAGDTRRAFHDWQTYRIESKKVERDHAARLIKHLDPEHILLADPGGTPFLCGAAAEGAYGLQVDYDDYAANPDIDGVFVCPGIKDDSWDDKLLPAVLRLFVRYFHSHGKAAFVQIENWDLNGDDERQLRTERWNYRAWAYFLASLGCGVTWSTGCIEHVPGQDFLQAEFAEEELAEIARCAYLVQSLPGRTGPEPGLALIDSPHLAMVDYHGRVPVGDTAIVPGGWDLLFAGCRIAASGLHFNVLTAEEIAADPTLLDRYGAVAVLDAFRMDTALRAALVAFRERGGGLALLGRTAVYDRFGAAIPTCLADLLGLSGPVDIERDAWRTSAWTFGPCDGSGLLHGVEGRRGDEANLYHIPTFDYEAEGYRVLARFDNAPSLAAVGVRDKTVFLFPKLLLPDVAVLPSFLANVYDHFGIGRDTVSPGVFSSGARHRFLLAEAAADRRLAFHLRTNGCEPQGAYTVFDVANLAKIEDVVAVDGMLEFQVGLSPGEPRLISLLLRREHPFFLGAEWCALRKTVWTDPVLELEMRARVGAEALLAIDVAGRTCDWVTADGATITGWHVDGESGVLVVSLGPASRTVLVRVGFR